MEEDRASDRQFAGKVVFVAGGSSGINLGVAQAFARAGARVGLISRSPERVEAAAASIRDEGHDALGIVADVRDFGAIEHALDRVVEQWGLLDVVVSGAAGNFHAFADTLSANGFRTVVDIDLNGTFNVFRAAHARLRSPGASLIAISAGQAKRPLIGQVHACAAKAGVNMLVECLALEWGPQGIRVNAISPGPIAGTEGFRRLLGDGVEKQVPLRRVGEIEDVADLALFLAGPRSSFITGTIIECDGGVILHGGVGAADRTDRRP